MSSRVDSDADLARRSFVALAVLTPALAVTGQASAEQAAPVGSAELPPALAQTLKDFYQAALKNDTTTLAGLVTDDYLLVNSDSSVQDKNSYMDDFRVRGFKMDPYVMQEPMQKVFGNAALTGGIMPLGWTQEGKHHKRLLRIAHVWVKQGGRWRVTYTQLTRIPE